MGMIIIVIFKNAKKLAEVLLSRGIKLVSGGTDNHLMLLDLTNYDITGKELEALLPKLMSFTVNNIVNKLIHRNSAPAFTTSTLQQDASSKLGFSPNKTMRIAQSLYEGKTIEDETVGLITYMRTDSTRLSNLFVDGAHTYIRRSYGDKYLGADKE